MPLNFVRGDLSRFEADVLVNAANSALREGGGVCGALFLGAGPEKMREACEKIGHCLPGDAVITPAFGLPAKHVVHAVGPVYKDGKQGEAAVLRKTYQSALKLAVDHGAKTIAFPLISSGAFAYPPREALLVAVSAIRDFLETLEDEPLVSLVLYERKHALTGSALAERLANVLRQIRRSRPEEYGADASISAFDLLDELKFQERAENSRNRVGRSFDTEAGQPLPKRAGETVFLKMRTIWEADAMPGAPAEPISLDELLEQKDEPFHISLMKLIDKKGLKDSEVYKRANMDRKHFSKIKSVKGYLPGKPAVMALALALRLDRAEAVDFLARAGYAFSPNKPMDIIIGYCIDQRQYNIDEINAILWEHDQALLGA